MRSPAICSHVIVAMLSVCAVAFGAQGGQPSAPFRQPRAAAASQAGDVNAGRDAMLKKGCASCHGREGQGSPTTGPRLGPNPLAFAVFTRAVRTPRNQMPPFAEALVSNQDLNDIYAFLRSRPGPESIDSLIPPQ